MKPLLIALFAIAASTHYASAEQTDPIATETTARTSIIQTIQVQSDKGLRLYIGQLTSQHGGAVIENDTSFALGPQASCDPLLGETTRDLVIRMQVTSRKQFPVGSPQSAVDTGQTGLASILIPKGTRMYGGCNDPQGSAGGMLTTSVRFESADPSTKFQITWAPKQVSVRCDVTVQ